MLPGKISPQNKNLGAATSMWKRVFTFVNNFVSTPFLEFLKCWGVMY